ncbi:MAG: zf-HC2 domain-containing protein [Polyangiales bacterium]
MSCERVRPELPGYHFNTLDEATRAEVEAHLVACARCVGEFVAVKRAIETAAHAPRPSDLSRARLRRAMAAAMGRPPRRAWWERPLAVSVAAASVLLALGAVQALGRAPGAAPFATRARPSFTAP